MKRSIMHSGKTSTLIRTIDDDLATVAGGEGGHWSMNLGTGKSEWVPYSPPDPNRKPSGDDGGGAVAMSDELQKK